MGSVNICDYRPVNMLSVEDKLVEMYVGKQYCDRRVYYLIFNQDL